MNSPFIAIHHNRARRLRLQTGKSNVRSIDVVTEEKALWI